MTEAEWLACPDPRELWLPLRGSVSERKARLFACACCRQLSRGQPAQAIHTALEMAEEAADGKLTWEELEKAENQTLASLRNLPDPASHLATWLLHPHGHKAAGEAIGMTRAPDAASQRQ